MMASSSICSLPEEIIWFLLQYVDEEERIEFAACCRNGYDFWMRRFLRKIRIGRFYDFDKHEEYTKTIDRQHEFPLKEFEIRNLLQGHDYQTVYFRPSTSMKRYTVSVKGLSDLLTLRSLTFQRVVACLNTAFCDLKNLQHLCLDQCDVFSSDISMLGSIPHLELKYCQNIVDIASLNDNDHVVIEQCGMIKDYSRSFANSRKIEIVVSREGNQNVSFDLARWSKVEDLKLELYPSHTFSIHYHHNNNRLPETVKRCHLEGTFVSTVDFTVTTSHRLYEIKLFRSYDNSITSVEGYGLERVTNILCDSLPLKSVKGLGRGKNRKIEIYRCHGIYDFSPLNHIAIVKVCYCKGLSTYSELGSVRDLTVSSIKNYHCFESNFMPYSFCLTDMVHITDYHFYGFQNIPHLQLNWFNTQHLRKFLEEGNQLFNQRIVLVRSECNDLNGKEILALHHQYMKDDYEDFRRLPEKWVWVRKIK